MAGIPIKKLAALGARLGMSLGAEATELVTLNVGHAQGAYNPATDTHAPSEGHAVTLPVMPFDRKNTQTGATLQVADREFTANTETLMVELATLRTKLQEAGMSAEEAAAVVVDETDTVTRATGEWAIVRVQYPPGAAFLLLDVRK